MPHPNTQRLIDEWRRQKSGESPPPRTSISPVAFGPLLPQLFLLGTERVGLEEVRLDGGLIADLHGRDLRGADFFELWSRQDRPRVRVALAMARSNAMPVLLNATATSVNGVDVALEISLAPLIGASGLADRTIGLYQPLTPVSALMGRPVSQMHLSSVEVTGAADVSVAKPTRGHLRLVVDNSRSFAVDARRSGGGAG